MKMKKLLLFVILTLSLLMPSLALAKVKVVATLPTLAAVAREMGGDEVTVDVLATTSQDPHFVDARPDYILKANKADLLIYNGMELEIGWLPPIQKSARNARIMDGAIGALDASTAIRALDVARTKVERSQGDIHAQGNPHYLYSLEEVILVSKAVSEKLAQLDPEHAALFRARYANFEARAQKKAAEAKARFAALPAPKKSVVAYHDSMPYLLQWLGLTQLATIEPKPGIAPSPSHVAQLVSQMKASQPAYIVQEVWQPRSTSEQIAKLTGAKLVILPVFPNNNEDLLAFYDRMLASF